MLAMKEHGIPMELSKLSMNKHKAKGIAKPFCFLFLSCLCFSWMFNNAIYSVTTDWTGVSYISGTNFGANVTTTEKDPSETLILSNISLLQDQLLDLRDRFDSVLAVINKTNMLPKQVEHLQDRLMKTETLLSNSTINSHGNKPLLSCDEFMQSPSSPFIDASFLTAYTTSISWTPRADGSRQFDLKEHCKIKRYTAAEARMCLTSTHVSFIGDSLTRYLYLSLVYFVENSVFPPPFRRRDPCTHINETGHATCSQKHQPNICSEGDWIFDIPAPWLDPWEYYLSELGGGADGGMLHGRLECSCGRSNKANCTVAGHLCSVENELYTNGESNTTLSYIKEDGWGDDPGPVKGFNFTGCSKTGSCRQSKELYQQRINRSDNLDFDWRQPFPEAIGKNGTLRDVLLKPDVAIYNRGLWGELSLGRAKNIMPYLYDWVGGEQGRCFFRSTMGSGYHNDIFQRELQNVRPAVNEAGCSYLDFGFLTQPFDALSNRKFNMPENVSEQKPWQNAERGSVYWDHVHFQPWVYEELNQVLLNVLCNWRKW